MKKIQTLISRVSLVVATLMLSIGLAPVANAQFPGTNGRIVFNAISGSIGTGVFSMKPDFTNVHQYSFPFINSGAHTGASFSPDGTRMAYFNETAGQVDIFVANSDGSGTPVQITNDAADERYVRWSPDGTQLVYSKLISGVMEIVTKLADGTGSEFVRTDGAGATASAMAIWGPDSTVSADRIYFIRSNDIFYVDSTAVNTAASEATATAVGVTGATGIDSSNPIDVSPNGNTLLFRDNAVGGGRIATAPVAGGALTYITTADLYNKDAQYSPDGTRIIYVGPASPDFDIPLIIADTSGNTITSFNPCGITNGCTDSNYFPFWSTSQATLSDNIGDDNFDSSDTPGVPNTTATITQKNSPVPWMLGGLLALMLLGLGGFWVTRELKAKK